MNCGNESVTVTFNSGASSDPKSGAVPAAVFTGQLLTMQPLVRVSNAALDTLALGAAGAAASSPGKAVELHVGEAQLRIVSTDKGAVLLSCACAIVAHATSFPSHPQLLAVVIKREDAVGQAYVVLLDTRAEPVLDLLQQAAPALLEQQQASTPAPSTPNSPPFVKRLSNVSPLKKRLSQLDTAANLIKRSSRVDVESALGVVG